MVRNIIFVMLGLISFGICFSMFVIGNSNARLSELKDFWFLPIPIGLFFMIAGIAGILKKIAGTARHCAVE